MLRAIGFLLITATLAAAPSTRPQFLLQWGKRGSGPGEFHSPIGLAIDPASDQLLVAEFNNSRVQRFDSSGRFLAQYPVIEHPGGIAVDDTGRIYITAMQHPGVFVYSRDGKQIERWGGSDKGEGEGQFNNVGGIAFGPDGTLYVADQGNCRIQRFTREGKVVQVIGAYGTALGQFAGKGKFGTRFGGPHFIAFDRDGFFYTTESTEGRVQKFTGDGIALIGWGDNRNQPGSFGGRDAAERNPLLGPIGLCVDRQQRVWVSATSSRVQLFTREGRYLLTVGEEGEGPGQFDLPHAIVEDRAGNIYIADASNQRIQKFAP